MPLAALDKAYTLLLRGHTSSTGYQHGIRTREQAGCLLVLSNASNPYATAKVSFARGSYGNIYAVRNCNVYVHQLLAVIEFKERSTEDEIVAMMWHLDEINELNATREPGAPKRMPLLFSASHLCDNSRCIRRGHVIAESLAANVSRQDCAALNFVSLTCVNCGHMLPDRCPHVPKCIRGAQL